MSGKQINQRDFLDIKGAGMVGLLIGGLSQWVRLTFLKSVQAQTVFFCVGCQSCLTAKEKWVEILPGAQTRVWGYEGQLLTTPGVIAQAAPGSYDSVNQGMVTGSPKDTVIFWPGKRVKITLKFSPYTGLFMYHYHVLEHEDMTMMRNFFYKRSNLGNVSKQGVHLGLAQ